MTERIKMSTTTYEEFAKRAGIEYKEYQKEGVSWCVKRENASTECCGGIVADEMGLGKTIMMISLMILNFVSRTLIIVPPALMYQWQDELYKTTGHRAFIYHGANKENLTEKTYYPIVIATYAAISQSKQGHLGFLHKLNWDRVVFDEAHHLRNNGCKLSGARLLRATRRWFITGTPIQNSIKDLMNIFSVFKDPPAFTNMESLIQTYVLRRTKTQVGIHLPPVTIHNIPVSWISTKERGLAKLVHSGFGGGVIKIQQMLQSRQMCIYPPILRRLDPEFTEECCSKMDAVVDVLLARQGNGNGKLVFCHFREEIDEVVRRLSKVITAIGVCDGNTSKEDRLKLGEGCEVLILQIKTGCEGLNLQHGFNEVYFVSPHWNPAVEDQAIARCHRIGQEKEVFVFRFKMTSYHKNGDDEEKTIESYITDVQDRKRDVYHTLLTL